VTGLRLGPAGPAVAVVVARDGRLPVGSEHAFAEAGGRAIVVGSGAEAGAGRLVGAGQVWWSDTGPGLRPGALAAWLAPTVESIPLVLLPASPDGRDLAPRLAAALGRPLVAGAVRATCRTGGPGAALPSGEPSRAEPYVDALVSRLDDRVLVPVGVEGPAVVTLVPEDRVQTAARTTTAVRPLPLREGSEPAGGERAGPEAEMIALLEPDLHTMDLSDAARVVSGGAGLAAGLHDRRATEVFELLGQVAAALGGSAGATRVVTDAGWTGYERQIGTTGVTIDPDLYIAFGVSGAAQHLGGLGAPRHIVSVNTDASCPMTAMADLGLVTDARALLVELAHRLGVVVPTDLAPSEQDGARRV
jgi:electron transfer flavoprotein alpha subunit